MLRSFINMQYQGRLTPAERTKYEQLRESAKNLCYQAVLGALTGNDTRKEAEAARVALHDFIVDTEIKYAKEDEEQCRRNAEGCRRLIKAVQETGS